MPIYYSKHIGDQTDSKQIVGIGEETDTTDNNGSDMVPAERGFVNFSESESSALVWILDVSLCPELVHVRVNSKRDTDIVVVKVVEGGVTTSSVGGHDERGLQDSVLQRRERVMDVG